MELILNLAAALITVLMFLLWLRYAPRTGSNRSMQLVALAVLVLTLFPVISVTDDLQAALNPAETDCCVRRDHACASLHSTFLEFATRPLPTFAELSHSIVRVAAPGGHSGPVIEHPSLAPIQNRPPPTA
jgi:hypothetical protein